MTLHLRSPCFRTVLLTLVLASTFAACGGPWRDAYFKKGVNRLTQDDVSEKMGPPHTAKTPALGGDTVWTYRVPYSDKDLDPMDLGLASAAKDAASMIGKGTQDGPKTTLYCYRYTLTFNEQKILKSWKREECVPGTRDSLQAS